MTCPGRHELYPLLIHLGLEAVRRLAGLLAFQIHLHLEAVHCVAGFPAFQIDLRLEAVRRVAGLLALGLDLDLEASRCDTGLLSLDTDLLLEAVRRVLGVRTLQVRPQLQARRASRTSDRCCCTRTSKRSLDCCRSLILRDAVAAPTIRPAESTMGDSDADTFTTVPSTLRRSPTNCSTSSPAMIRRSNAASSSRRSGGTRISAGRPTMSWTDEPYIRAAAGLQLVITPLRLIPMIASCDEAMIKAASARSSPVCVRPAVLAISTTQAANRKPSG